MGDRLKDKVAIVTGAGSIGPGWGNGKATAVLYAREGAKVVTADINEEAARDTARIIADEGGEASVFEANVADAAQVSALIDHAIETFGRINVLHNNVGLVEVGGPVEITEENWDRLIDTNVKSVFLACKYALPHMVAQNSGAIVNVSSIAALRYVGYPSVSYNASKGAINQLTQNVAVQYAGKGIRANCILPGLMDTPMIHAFVTGGYDGDDEAMVAERNALCPMGRMGDAWDVAKASVFLASDDASYITGHMLVVDGGITCKFG
ncbi:MAG: SDR family NAD(P)-dependent oxidoreductase [Hyphomicrobiales bacterium]